jgi:hypothetical protein
MINIYGIFMRHFSNSLMLIICCGVMSGTELTIPVKSEDLTSGLMICENPAPIFSGLGSLPWVIVGDIVIKSEVNYIRLHGTGSISIGATVDGRVYRRGMYRIIKNPGEINQKQVEVMITIAWILQDRDVIEWQQGSLTFKSDGKTVMVNNVIEENKNELFGWEVDTVSPPLQTRTGEGK